MKNLHAAGTASILAGPFTKTGTVAMFARLVMIIGIIALLLALTLVTASGQETDRVRFEDTTRPVNRFGLSYRPGFNISAKFKNGGGAQANPGPAQSGVNHNYDDGYNRLDSSGNTGQGACENCTWNWGYDRASQISTDGRFLSLSATTSESETDADSDEPHHGAELTYQREFGQLGRVYWGLEAAFNYTTLDFEGDADLTRTTDRYSLTVNGTTVVPPAPPYRGSFQGPGPVISDIPLRSITALPGAGGSHEVEADIYGFRIGPYIEWPFAEKWSFLFSGGLAIASINSDFSFDEPGLSVDDSDSDWNFGAYVSGNIIYSITEAVDVFTGVQFQHLGDYDHEAGGKEVELDLGQSIYAVVGLGFSF